MVYGSVITPDLAAAVALLGSSYLFWRWLKEPTWAWGTALSATLALAMLTKSVWLILPPLFVMIWAVVALVGRTKTGAEQSGEPLYRRFASWLRGARGKQAIQLVAASLIALTITNAFYGFDRSLQPLGQYTFVSSTFSGNAPQKRSTMSIFSGGGDQPHFVAEKGNRFSGWLAAVPVPLPANYLQGIDVQIRDFERGAYDSHWQSYLMGQWQQGGWWYYYIVALFVKVQVDGRKFEEPHCSPRGSKIPNFVGPRQAENVSTLLENVTILPVARGPPSRPKTLDNRRKIHPLCCWNGQLKAARFLAFFWTRCTFYVFWRSCSRLISYSAGGDSIHRRERCPVGSLDRRYGRFLRSAKYCACLPVVW